MRCAIVALGGNLYPPTDNSDRSKHQPDCEQRKLTDCELRVGLTLLTPDKNASLASLYIRLGLPVIPGWRNALNGECEPRFHVMSDPD